jgi:hypothetical protein
VIFLRGKTARRGICPLHSLTLWAFLVYKLEAWKCALLVFWLKLYEVRSLVECLYAWYNSTYSRQRSEKGKELTSGQFFDHNVKETLLQISLGHIFFFFFLWNSFYERHIWWKLNLCLDVPPSLPSNLCLYWSKIPASFTWLSHPLSATPPASPTIPMLSPASDWINTKTEGSKAHGSHPTVLPSTLPLPPHGPCACQGGAHFLMFTSTENDVNLVSWVADVKWSVCLAEPPRFTNVPIKLTYVPAEY